MLTKEERRGMLELARRTIEARLSKKNPPPYDPCGTATAEPRGAFVTLHKSGSLRGCIGCLEAIKPLYQTVREMAVASAFQDPRFPPLSPGEIGEIEIEISVMSPISRVSSVNDIEVGRHGIIIKRGFYQGLLLPQVASEQGWDRDTFLEHTCRKAGLPMDSWKKPETEIYVFSAEVFSEKSY